MSPLLRNRLLRFLLAFVVAWVTFATSHAGVAEAGFGRIVRPVGGTAVFDPATLSLTGWWRASYSGSPWTPTASAGTSGANGNLTEATNPPATGTAQNGFTPATFDGVDDILANANTTSTFFSASAWSLAALIYINTAAAYGADEYDNESVFAATGAAAATIGLAVSTSGVSVWHADGADWPGVTVACGTGAWHLAQAKYDGTNIKLRIDSGGWSSVAASNVSGLAGETLQWGTSWSSSAYFDGRLLETIFANTALSDGDFDNYKSYVNAHYALAL